MRPFHRSTFGEPVGLSNGSYVAFNQMHSTRLFDTIKRLGLLPLYGETVPQVL